MSQFSALHCFSRTRGSGVHLSCVSPSESEVVAKATHSPPLDMPLANWTHYWSPQQVDCYCKYRGALDPGPWEHSHRSRTRDEWHTTRTRTVFVFPQCRHTNAKPAMHATGGRGPYQWAGHAFVCLLGSLTIHSTSIELKTKPRLTRRCLHHCTSSSSFLLSFSFFSMKLEFDMYRIFASEQKNKQTKNVILRCILVIAKACQRVAVEKWWNITSDAKSAPPSSPPIVTVSYWHTYTPCTVSLIGNFLQNLKKTNKLIFRLGPWDKYIRDCMQAWHPPFHGNQRVN